MKGLKNWFVITRVLHIRMFVIPMEFVRGLLGRIQGTRHLVRYTGKFVLSGVRCIWITLYTTV